MKPLLLTSIFFIVTIFNINSQNLPEGYILQFEEPCNREGFLKTFVTNNSHEWKIEKNLIVLPIHEQTSDSIDTDQQSQSLGVINNLILGEFIMNFEFLPKYKGSNDFYFIGPVKSPDNMYSFRFTGDSVQFTYLLNGESMATEKKAFSIKNGAWNKISVKRDMLKRSLTFTNNVNPNVIAEFSHPGLVMGYIGFGSDSSLYEIKNIKIWGPTSIRDKEFCW